MKQVIRLIFIVAMVVAAFACTESKFSYESVKGDPLKTRIYTLDNGLKVYMTVNKETPRIQTYIAVKVGAKNDPAETTGLAHYFEHLMFKGTENYGTMDFASEQPLLDRIEAEFESYRNTAGEEERRVVYRIIDSLSFEASKLAIPNEYDKLMSAIGADGTNAYTGYDMTVYIEDIPSNQIDNWAKIQADRFENNVIRGFHTELETVYEEKNMSLTRDSRKVSEAMLAALFPNHPYGTQTVLGSQEHLKNPSITNIKEYYKTWYVPNNMAICLSGDFDPEQMIETIDKYFGGMQPNPDLPRLQTEELPAMDQPVIKEVLGPEAENLTLAWRAGSYSSEDADKLSILTSVLYNGKAGLIDLNVLQKQKMLSGYSYYMPMADHGAVVFNGRPKAGQTLDDVKELLFGEIGRLKAGDFDEGLLEATINNYKANIMRYTDSNDGRADWFVTAFINGLDWRNEVEQLDRMSKITKEDIVELANRLFGGNDYVAIYKREGKDPNESRIAKPEITPIFVNRDTSSLFLREIQDTEVKPIEPVFLDYDRDLDRLRAKSGIEVLYNRNQTNGLFNITYLYETGSNNDPGMGIAFEYLNYLGTSAMTPEQFQQELYKIACSFSVFPSSERSYITLSGLSENMGHAMELLEDLLSDAQPNPEALENMKSDILKRRADSKLNQSSNFSMLRNYSMYGPKSPATNVLSAEQIEALTPEDLLAKIESLGSMEHRMLYYGPSSHKELLSAIDKYRLVPDELRPVPELVRFPYLETPGNTVLVAYYDAPQIYYSQYSNRGEKYDPANDPGVSMYNEYFGGGMNSIVFQEMRESRGLAYSANAFLGTPSRLDNPYIMTAFIATQNDKMAEAIDAFDDIINNMPESENAFALAKEGIITRIRTERIIKENILWNYVNALDMGVSHDRRENIFNRVQAMTLSDVKEFQQKWIKGRNYTFCVLGDSKELDMKKLESLGPVRRLTREEIFGY